MEEISPKELDAYESANLSVRYERKTTTKTMNPAPYVPLMAFFERYLKKKNSTFLSKALINRQP